MDTYCVLAEETSRENLATEIDIIKKSPVINGLLHSVGGMLAVINDRRQIVALNDSLLKALGVGDPAEALGLRPGEALQCIHAGGEPNGCGTTKWCSTCGAAIAMVSSFRENKPIEKVCALSARRKDRNVDIALLVRSHPIIINDNQFLLLFLQDITLHEQRAALERTFFHDVNNLLSMMVGACELLLNESHSEFVQAVHQVSLRLVKEVAIQQNLLKSETYSYQPIRHWISSKQIFFELRSFFANHPAALGKKIDYQEDYPAVSIYTDSSLLSRILCNMVINALEATNENGFIKVWIEQYGRCLTFCVWNAQRIPQEIVYRIFQRNFSTKKQSGRGIGTFSMKLFGEKVLGGKVSFSTSAKEGTIFKFSLPLCDL